MKDSVKEYEEKDRSVGYYKETSHTAQDAATGMNFRWSSLAVPFI